MIGGNEEEAEEFITLSQLQKRFRKENRPKVELELPFKQRLRDEKP